MLVLHGGWHLGRLVLWGEDSALPARTTARGAVRPHPYAPGEAALREAVAALAADTGMPAPRKAESVTLELALPGSGTHPLPSPALGPLDGAPAVRDPEVRRWSAPALAFPGASAYSVLALLRAARVGDVAAGPGPAHLVAVAELAERLLTAGRVIPMVIGAPPEARWRPVLTGDDAELFRALAAALPPVARAHRIPDPADTSGAADPDGFGRPADSDDPDRPADRATDSEDDGSAATVFAALCALVDSAARQRAGAPPPPASGPTAALVRALTGPDPVLPPTDPPEATARLAARLRAWAREAHHEGDRARLGFRLVEPERHGTAQDDDGPPAPRTPAESGADERTDAEAGAAPGTGTGSKKSGGKPPEVWHVEFWVHSDRDPSLHVPLRELWLGSGGAWLPDDVETTVLRDLTRAARHYPALHRVLRELAPGSLSMGTGGAYTFIRDAAPALSAAGFDVVLPHWAQRSALGLHMDAVERPPAKDGGIGVSDLLDFSFQAVLGDQRVDLEELAELARLKQPLVRLRGHWVHADPALLDAALDFLKRRGRGTMRREEALRMLLAPGAGARTEGAGTGPGGRALPVVGVDADGALGALLDGGVERRISPMDTPPGFHGSLRPYQERGASWLRFLGGLGLGAILADDMGLGKTVQLLALLTDERATGAASPGPTLLICPVSLAGNWRREAARFAPGLRVHVHHGPSRPHGNALARLMGETDLVVTTYGVVVRDSDELAAMPWHRVVCDEAQAVKNSGTRQAKAVRALPASTRIALTGTPVENNVGELWSIMEFANPGLLGPRAAFDSAAAKAQSEDGGPGEGAALLKRVTGPFVLRRLKTDRTIISDLPEKHEMRSWCTLTPEQASLYQATVAEMTERVAEADGIQRKGLVLSTMARLKQICNHPAHFLGDGSALAGRSGKLARLEDLLSEALAEGDKALCFTQYTAFGDRLAPYLAARLGHPVLWLHGGTSRPRREELMERFQTAEGPMVFLLSLKAAGTGLNLTAANHVVHIDRWWNPAVEDQATDRAFRIGQRRDVQVRKLVCVGTMEERVDEMIEAKKALAQSVVGTGEDWLTELSTAELREVVRLSPEAVA